MPIYHDPNEDPYDPPPNIPPVTGGGGGAPAPAQGGQEPPGPSGGGGGGGGGAPLVRPQFAGFNAPGAPKFIAPTFVAPDRAALLSDPGYLARVDAGQKALERSAAAKGWLRTGGHGQQLVDYSQGQASQEYGQAFNRGLNAYDRNYQKAKDVYAPEFARWQMNSDAGKQAALLGYQTDLSHWQQASAPHYEPAFDPRVLFEGDGAEEGPPDRARYTSTSYGPPDDDPRRLNYNGY